MDEPPELLAYTVYCVLERRIPGVPLMTPLTVLKWNAGPGYGEISQLVTVPPVMVGLECGLIETLSVATMSSSE